MKSSRKNLLLVIATIVLVAVVYLVWFGKSDIDGWYTVRDTFVDSTGRETAVILFVEVPEYDSAKMRKTAVYESEEWSGKTVWDLSRNRTLLFHFFKAADTLPLTEYMIGELAYSNPSISNPTELLQTVPNGWVVKMDFPKNAEGSTSTEMRAAQFYKPRPGVKARDLRHR